MKFSKIIVAVLVLGCTIVPIVTIFAYEAYRSRNLTHEIIARAPERGNYFPQKITSPVGKQIRLRVRNVDTVMHGFAIPDLDVDAGEISAGHHALLEFTPEQTGIYDFYCTTWCGDYHVQMRGILEVTDN